MWPRVGVQVSLSCASMQHPSPVYRLISDSVPVLESWELVTAGDF